MMVVKLHEMLWMLLGINYSEVLITLFLTNVVILHPLKTLEKLSFFNIFRRYKMGTLTKNGLMTRNRYNMVGPLNY